MTQLFLAPNIYGSFDRQQLYDLKLIDHKAFKDTGTIATYNFLSDTNTLPGNL